VLLRPDDPNPLAFYAVKEASSGRQSERLADVFWMLLNRAEFRLNH
jgi:hypothetical protein